MGPAVPGASYTVTLHSPLRADFIPGTLDLSLSSEDNTPPLTPTKHLEQLCHTPTKETEDCTGNTIQHPTPPAAAVQQETAQQHTAQQYTNQQLEAPVPNRLYPIFKELYVAQNKVAQRRHHTNIANNALETQTFFINPNVKLQAVNPNDQLHKEFKELTTHYQNKVTELLRDHYIEQYHIFDQNATNIQSRINALSDPEGPRAIAKAQSIAHKKYTPTNKKQPKDDRQRQQSRTHPYASNTNTLQTTQHAQHRPSYSQIATHKPVAHKPTQRTQHVKNPQPQGKRGPLLPTPALNPQAQRQRWTPRDSNQPKTNYQTHILNKRAPLLSTPNTTPRDHNQPKINYQAQTHNKRAPLLPTPSTTLNNQPPPHITTTAPTEPHTKEPTPTRKPTITPLMDMVIPTPPRYKYQKQHTQQYKPSKPNTAKHTSTQPPKPSKPTHTTKHTKPPTCNIPTTQKHKPPSTASANLTQQKKNLQQGASTVNPPNQAQLQQVLALINQLAQSMQ